ncbi:hypothetical protein [Candidatus Poriferisodalis sp.]|uniref:hypothetical protein n=1 Tax=Candidatus Poriferisodalis sp. TaxID=3101277 RepID=UPI003AF51EE2
MDDWGAHGAAAAVAVAAFGTIYAIIKKFLGQAAHQLERLGDKIDTTKDKTFEVHTEMQQVKRQADG